jgi:hypothetical protein
MSNFLKKHYPGIKRNLHLKRIQNLEELLEEVKEEYIK